MRPFMLIIFLITFLIPVVSISFLRVTNTINSFKLNNRKERIIPFSFISVFYLTATFLFIYKVQMGPSINLVLGTITAIIIFITVITFFWKISAHSAGVGGMLGFMLAFYLKDPQFGNLWILALIVIISGAVMSSRLYLNVHNPRQVYAGALIGFLISFLSILLLS